MAALILGRFSISLGCGCAVALGGNCTVDTARLLTVSRQLTVVSCRHASLDHQRLLVHRIMIIAAACSNFTSLPSCHKLLLTSLSLSELVPQTYFRILSIYAAGVSSQGWTANES
ncbi:uncharacterized protein LY89DRAFT_288212 [Mollisia scopiformis]|uniref:Secreted protein n=1 Tax=Mollisia scopiformis TaxID=149040 RepID=A0A132BB17_MOLSC|nr:uncharacterized protein LY89DRAFT_288212 [Mollisia scopiformis]KUJ09463.1 hypothetical protein LY89DRAFT_288212 [Mollisia scopiformis]